MAIPVEAYTKEIDEIIEAAETSENGLSQEEAEIRLELYGENLLEENEEAGIPELLLGQFKNPANIILVISAVLAALSSGWAEMAMITVIAAISIAAGFFRDRKTDEIITAINRSAESRVAVMRDGMIRDIPASQLVTGDIVEVGAGDLICADIRLTSSAALRVDQSALPGGRSKSDKDWQATADGGTAAALRRNMLFSGTSALSGSGRGVVTATGKGTELGRDIAASAGGMSGAGVQGRLGRFAYKAAAVFAGVGVVIALLYALRPGMAKMDAALLALCLCAAAAPTGLMSFAGAVTASGLERMLKKNIIVKSPAVTERLSGVEILCADRTGMLTQDSMQVDRVYCAGRLVTADAPINTPGLEQLVETMVFCNDASFRVGSDGKRVLHGDSTEVSLIEYAMSLGYDYEKRIEFAPRRYEFSFDPEIKLMSTFHQYGGQYIQYTKGAPEILMERCDRVMVGSEVHPFTAELKAVVKDVNTKLASVGLHVLAGAIGLHIAPPSRRDDAENGLVFLGMVGMLNRLLPETAGAVSDCIAASVRPIMITGDHKLTAAAAAREAGILDGIHFALTGDELDRMSDSDFQSAVGQYSAYARVGPGHRARIVSAWKNRGKVTAVTGSAVGDIAALKAADIGISMTKTGSEAAKAAADIVVENGSFANVVEAVRESRVIYGNIRKLAGYLLSSGIALLLAVLVFAAIGQPALGAVQVLLISLLTGILPAEALGRDRAENDIMKGRPSLAATFSRRHAVGMVCQGALAAGAAIAAYFVGRSISPAAGSTMAFCVLVFARLVNSLSARSDARSAFHRQGSINKPLLIIIAALIAVTVLLVCVPVAAGALGFVPLGVAQWIWVAALSAGVLLITEIIKLLMIVFGKKSTD